MMISRMWLMTLCVTLVSIILVLYPASSHGQKDATLDDVMEESHMGASLSRQKRDCSGGKCIKCFAGSANLYNEKTYCSSDAYNCTLVKAPDGRVTRGCSETRGSFTGCKTINGYIRCFCTDHFCNDAMTPKLTRVSYVLSVLLIIVLTFDH